MDREEHFSRLFGKCWSGFYLFHFSSAASGSSPNLSKCLPSAEHWESNRGMRELLRLSSPVRDLDGCKMLCGVGWCLLLKPRPHALCVCVFSWTSGNFFYFFSIFSFPTALTTRVSRLSRTLSVSWLV